MLGSAAASGRIADSPALAVSFLYRLFVGVPSQERSRHDVAFPPNPRSVCSVVGARSYLFFEIRRGAQGEAALLVVFVIVFSDSDRVGRGEWSRVYDACMVVRVYLSGLRTSCMPRRCLRRLKTRHPYHLGGVFWYGSSISIIIYLSLIRGR